MRTILLCLILIALPGAVSVATPYVSEEEVETLVLQNYDEEIISASASFVLDKTEIEIPIPQDFSEATADTTLFDDNKKIGVDYLMLSFAPNKNAPAALRSKTSEPKILLSVSTFLSLSNILLTMEEFKEIQENRKKQISEIVISAETAAKEMAENIMDQEAFELSESFIPYIVSLPLQTEFDFLAIFPRSSSDINDEADNTHLDEILITAMILVKGKVLCVTASMKKSDIDIGQGVLTDWLKTIIETNSPKSWWSWLTNKFRWFYS